MALQWRKQLIFLSVLELLVAFIQYVHDGKLKTNFLFVEVLLKASNYKLSQGKHTVTMAKLLTLKLELNKMREKKREEDLLITLSSSPQTELQRAQLNEVGPKELCCRLGAQPLNMIHI